MGFGPAAVLGVVRCGHRSPGHRARRRRRLRGSNPNVVATAVEMGIAPVWVVMNNSAFGTIAGLERKHYGTGYGCEFEAEGAPYSPDFAAIARACGADGIRIERAEDLEPALRQARRVRAGRRSWTSRCATRPWPPQARGTSSASTTSPDDRASTRAVAAGRSAPGRRAGPRASRPRPRSGSSCAASPSTTPSARSPSRPCSCDSGAGTSPATRRRSSSAPAWSPRSTMVPSRHRPWWRAPSRRPGPAR